MHLIHVQTLGGIGDEGLTQHHRPPAYLVLHSSGVGHVCLVPRQSDHNVGAGLPLQLLHPGLGSRERVLEVATC